VDVFDGNICFAAPDHSTPSTQVGANLKFKFIGQIRGLIDQQSRAGSRNITNHAVDRNFDPRFAPAVPPRMGSVASWL